MMVNDRDWQLFTHTYSHCNDYLGIYFTEETVEKACEILNREKCMMENA